MLQKNHLYHVVDENCPAVKNKANTLSRALFCPAVAEGSYSPEAGDPRRFADWLPCQ